MSILIQNARVMARAAQPPTLGDVLIEGDRIAGVGPGITTLLPPGRIIDAGGRIVLAGLVDCHTHACFAGERLDEWDRRRQGATYLEILASGGGIMSTVRAVRAASKKELADHLARRLAVMADEGTTTVEVKSGYGLSTRDELKMLHAIDDAAAGWPGTVVKTALLGHAVDPDVPSYFDRTIGETLDAVHAQFPGLAVDVYCEKGAWPLEQADRLLRRAASLGHPVRVHTDQFHSLGMVERAIELGARSVDHLEASDDRTLELLGGPGRPFAVGLPISGFHLDGRYTNLRSIIDRGGRVAIATNFNPGSAPSSSMPLAIALAVRQNGLSAAEAIAAATTGGAGVLGLDDRGEIRAGARADLVVLRHNDERMLAYEVGGNPADVVIAGGRIIRG